MPGNRGVWEDVDIRIYIDGDEKGLYFATRASWQDEIVVDKAKHQGASTPSLDGHYNGGSGDIEFLLQAGFADPTDVFEEHKQHLKDRIPGGEVRIVFSRKRGDSQVREARRFDNCFPQPTERSGENQRTTVAWNFQFENSERIAG